MKLFRCVNSKSSLKIYQLRTISSNGKVSSQVQWSSLKTSFPDLISADEFEATAKFQQSIPLVSNVHEILVNATGASSPLSLLLSHKIASLNSRCGRTDVVLKMLQKYVLIPENKDIDSKIKAYQLLAESNLSSGFVDNALSWVDSGIDMGEGNNVGLELFHPLYTLKGSKEHHNIDSPRLRHYL